MAVAARGEPATAATERRREKENAPFVRGTFAFPVDPGLQGGGQFVRRRVPDLDRTVNVRRHGDELPVGRQGESVPGVAREAMQEPGGQRLPERQAAVAGDVEATRRPEQR